MTLIPLVDLSAQHAAVADEVAAGWQEVLARTAFIGGPQVTAKSWLMGGGSGSRTR